MTKDGLVSRADFAWLAAAVARLFNKPLDIRSFGANHPAPHSPAQLALALRDLGIEVEPNAGTQRRAGTLGWIGWQRVASADVEPAHTDLSAVAEPTATLLEPILIERDANGVARMHAPRASVALERASKGEAKLDLIETWALRLAEIAPPVEDEGAAEPRAAPAGDAAPAKPFGFSTIWREVIQHRSIWRHVLLASLAIQVVGLGTPLLTQVIIDKVLVHQTISTLVVVAAALVVFMLFTSAMTWVRQYLVLHTGNKIDAVLGDQVIGHLLRLPVPWFERRPTGTVIARLHGVETIREFLTGAAITLVLDLPFLLIFLAIMFAYSWQLSLIALGITILIAILSAAVTPALRRRLDEQFMAGARTQAFTTEYVAGYETVKAMQLEPQLRRTYGNLLASYLSATFSTKQLGNTFNTIAGGLEQLMTLSILVVGALIVMRNEGFTIGMLVAFQMFASRMTQPMMRIVGLWQEFQQASIAVKRLGDLMNAPAEPHDALPSRASQSRPAAVSVEAVGFRYGSNQPWTLQDFSLALAPGQLTVLTGASGSGKSTLTKLLLGYRRPESGRIRLDGRDIAFLAANELRAAFGVVPQETVLFSGTILENLQLAKPDASFEDICAACKLAEIHEAIEQLPQGYATPLGEHGVGLSGGQRQRIAIARALLRQPRVLIFDEATSALDTETAEAFARTVNALRGRTTILFIAHHVPRGLRVDQLLRIGETPRPTAPSSATGTGQHRA